MGTALLLRSQYERNSLTYPFYRITTGKPLRRDRTIVFLSDLHDKTFGPGNRRLLNAVRSFHPDAVLFGGDMVNVKRRADIRPVLDFCEALTEFCPVYYGEGNHERRLCENRERYGNMYDTFLDSLRGMGVFHLSDSSAMLDDDIRISGLNLDEKFYGKFFYPKMDRSYIEKRVGSASDSFFQILLVHSPEYFGACAAWGADLVLSGHYHGGTIRLPGGVGLMTPQFTFFSRNVVGMKKIRGENGDSDSPSMIISSGLGTHDVNIRLNDKPQVVVVKLVRS